MNIEEAKKLIDKQSIGKGGVGDIPVVKTHIVKVLLDQLIQPKPEVPQFVADWYEENKYDFYLNLHKLAWELIENLDEDCFVLEKAIDSDFKRWYYRNKTAIKTLINMHQLGYTIEKEKLYTVEIPNPNSDLKIILVKVNKKLKLIEAYEDQLEEYKNIRNVTESEIRKDFDWAWQFREEVAE
ncbi:TPA: DUF1642 domain-containing protein [Streptococcus agalactiae]|uniref:DUF1642 domain-containing protein n=1 Tax=Streptococcus agalactiae TaxID=1311 RepID=UPI0013751694|nr:DUF1642 domain-containing protein [Streptococcus agalactiae]KAF1266598.1 hypothetical protein B8V72_04115 [Streptococcus agalactiae]HEN4525692.1 DUF1642 domain-containing protein [Streptococcus agalactiae]